MSERKTENYECSQQVAVACASVFTNAPRLRDCGGELTVVDPSVRSEFTTEMASTEKRAGPPALSLVFVLCAVLFVALTATFRPAGASSWNGRRRTLTVDAVVGGRATTFDVPAVEAPRSGRTARSVFAEDHQPPPASRTERGADSFTLSQGPRALPDNATSVVSPLVCC